MKIVPKLQQFNIFTQNRVSLIKFFEKRLNKSQFTAITYLNLNTYLDFPKALKPNQIKKFIFLLDGRILQLMFKLFYGLKNSEVTTFTYSYKPLLKLAEEKGYSIYFLGTTQDVLKKTIKKIKQEYPNLKIVGYKNGYFDNNDIISQNIKKVKPDILLIALANISDFRNNKKINNQEMFILQNWNILKNNTKLVICVGGLFDRLAGHDLQIPYWVNKLGIEWLIRLFVSPQKIFPRLIASIPFIPTFLYRYYKYKK